MSGFFSSLGFKKTDEFTASINQLLQEHGFAGETLKTFTIAQEMPTFWYAAIIGIFWAFLIKNHLLILTDKHLIVVDMDAFSNFSSFASYSFQELKITKISRFFLVRRLKISFPDSKEKTFSISLLNDGEKRAEEIVSSITGTSINQFQAAIIPNKSIWNLGTFFLLGTTALALLIAFGSLGLNIPTEIKAIRFRDYMIIAGTLLGMLAVFNIPTYSKKSAASEKICSKCQTVNNSEALFCSQCGQNLKNVVTQSIFSPQFVVGIVCILLVNTKLLDDNLTGFFALTGEILLIKGSFVVLVNWLKNRQNKTA